MQQYIVLLRAVNVSGNHLIKMAELKLYLSEHGYQQVQTYIQSGNIILWSDESQKEVQENVQRIIFQYFSHHIEVIALDKDTLLNVLKHLPFPSEYPANKVHVAFLQEAISKEQISTIQELDTGEEQFIINERYICFYLPDGSAKSKLSNAFFEKKLKVNATTRNINTLQNLIIMS